MKKILLFGAGKSATCLIEYLAEHSEKNKWELVVCDANLSLAKAKTKKYPAARAVSFDISDREQRHAFISGADIVISMLPPALHYLVAEDCIFFSKNLLTASYIDDKIKAHNEEIKKKGLLFLCEMGLDPGIDHMSAMHLVHDIKNRDGVITSFKSHCGGLVSPESDDNPWHYKITWNPANVVMAGAAGAIYREAGHTVTKAYEEIFSDDMRVADIPGLGQLAWYPNRDSLSYIDTYQLHGASDFLRTTLRYPAFCRGWNKIIRLGLTAPDDHEVIKDCRTFAEWFSLKAFHAGIHENGDAFFNAEFTEQLDYLGLKSREEIPFSIRNSAHLLQYALEQRLVMLPHDKDMIVMLHEIEYLLEERKHYTGSCLIVKGEDSLHTAMAKTVGLPLGIAARLILEGRITETGLHIPVIPGIYEPVLAELHKNGISFAESTRS